MGFVVFSNTNSVQEALLTNKQKKMCRNEVTHDYPPFSPSADSASFIPACAQG